MFSYPKGCFDCLAFESVRSNRNFEVYPQSTKPPGVVSEASHFNLNYYREHRIFSAMASDGYLVSDDRDSVILQVHCLTGEGFTLKLCPRMQGQEVHQLVLKQLPSRKGRRLALRYNSLAPRLVRGRYVMVFIAVEPS